MRSFLSVVAALAVTTVLATPAEAAPIFVSADATVVGGLFASQNFGSEATRGGLLSGLDGNSLFGPYRFYLAFTLPLFTPGTIVSSATLQGFYTEDWDTFDDRTHSFYQSPATWTESTITWNNQPGAIGGPLAAFNAAAALPGSVQSWDVTSVVNAAYLNHNLLFSLLFRADDEFPGAAPVTNNNLEYFASREFAPANAFRID